LSGLRFEVPLSSTGEGGFAGLSDFLKMGQVPRPGAATHCGTSLSDFLAGKTVTITSQLDTHLCSITRRNRMTNLYNHGLTSKRRGGSMTLVQGLLIATGVGAALFMARRQVWRFATSSGVLCFLSGSHVPRRHPRGHGGFQCVDCGKAAPSLEDLGFDEGGYIDSMRGGRW